MKTRVLRNWLVKVLSAIIIGWVLFCGMTIDSLGNNTYDTVFTVWTGLAIASYYLLKRYSNVLNG